MWVKSQSGGVKANQTIGSSVDSVATCEKKNESHIVSFSRQQWMMWVNDVASLADILVVLVQGQDHLGLQSRTPRHGWVEKANDQPSVASERYPNMPLKPIDGRGFELV